MATETRIFTTKVYKNSNYHINVFGTKIFCITYNSQYD